MVLTNTIPLTISKKETMIPSELKKYISDLTNESDSINEEVRIIGVKDVIPIRNEYPGHTDIYFAAKAEHKIPIEKKYSTSTLNFIMFRSSTQNSSEMVYIVHSKLIVNVE